MIGYIATGVIFFLVGFVVGSIREILDKPTKAGTIIVTGDEDGTYLSLQVEKDLSVITSNKEVCLDVVSRF